MLQQSAWNKPAFKRQRSVDLLPVCTTDRQVQYAAPLSVARIVAEIEQSQLTGILKVDDSKAKARAALLFYKGTVVGCVYTDIKFPQPQTSDVSLALFVALLGKHSVAADFYHKDPSVVVALSSLFSGFPIERNDNYTADGYIGFIGSSMQQKQLTGCLAVTRSDDSMVLALVHRGNWAGAFDVDKQWMQMNYTLFLNSIMFDQRADVRAYMAESPDPSGTKISSL
jgi:hypothetical protein